MDIYPSLTYRDVEGALAFLQTAFGLEPVVFDGDGRDAGIRFAAARHGNGMVMIQPELPEDLQGTHAGRGWVYVVVKDPECALRPRESRVVGASLRKALGAGARRGLG